MELDEAAEILREWAQRSQCVKRLWLFGSRVPESGKLPHPDSDLDVAVEVLGSNLDDPLALFVAKQKSWERLLRPLFPFPVRISYFPCGEPFGSSSNVSKAVSQYGHLVFCYTHRAYESTEEQ